MDFSDSDSSCELGAMSTWMLMLILPHLLPYITVLVNCNLIFKNAIMLEEIKHVILCPLLRNRGLQLIEKNFRPVSNSTFISKIIGKFATSQDVPYINENELSEPHQYAYKQFHTNETALIKVQNDFLLAKDRSEVSILILFDLFVAFDTIDHKILL